MKIGIIREGKNPPDSRVCFTPEQCKQLLEKFPSIDLVVQNSPVRCFKDEEYAALGIKMGEDMSDRDILLGIKEVPKEQLIAEKTYFYFSHTIKKQPYNRALLQTMMKKNIRMIDYETITENRKRLIGFGRYAGIVGAHNGVRAYGIKTKKFELSKAHKVKGFKELKEEYAATKWPAMKVVNTGNGKVAKGGQETLEAMGFDQVTPEDFVNKKFDKPVFVHLNYKDMYKNYQTKEYDKKDYYNNPDKYYCDFAPFYETADVFVNGIFWPNNGPVYFTLEEMRQPNFNLKVIADVTCDIAPYSSVPCTLEATVIGDDVFGYNPITEKKEAAYGENTIEVMSVDNLPNELPRDASVGFGEVMLEKIIPELIKDTKSEILHNATICEKGKLTENFSYLQDYVDGKS